MHELSLGWRSRSRIAAAVVLTFGLGVPAAAAGVPWLLRLVFAALFLGGVGTCLDAIVFTSSWRFTASALKIPTLLSRRREVSGRASGRDDLTVELRDGWWSRLAVTGPNGTRVERINPLVSGRDLRRWWDAAPD